MNGLDKESSLEIFQQIARQRQIGDELTQRVQNLLQPVYFPDKSPDQIECGTIGSYATGTMTDAVSDIDILVLNVPAAEGQGFTNWAKIETFSLTGSEIGIVRLDDVKTLDVRLAKAIELTLLVLEREMEAKPGGAVFNFVKSWPDYEGVIYCVSVDTVVDRHLEVEIILSHAGYQFGLEHTKRFRHYLDRLQTEFGYERAAIFIQEIRRLKKEIKKLARNPQDQTLDRRKKVAGFVIEALVACQYPPPKLVDISKKLKALHGRVPESQFETMADQTRDLIGEDLSFAELVQTCIESGAITKGGWLTLQSALDACG